MARSVRFRWVGENPGTWAEAQGKKIKKQLDEILEEIIAEAADDMIRILEAAWTETGQRRVEKGGNGPGRVDTGKMRDAIKARILQKSKDRTVGAWGWLDEVDFYFIAQEYGGEAFAVHFKGMAALQGSYIQAREKFRKRLKQIGREV
jgi:hypothetical protein